MPAALGPSGKCRLNIARRQVAQPDRAQSGCQIEPHHGLVAVEGDRADIGAGDFEPLI
jgi:hypothetical protein